MGIVIPFPTRVSTLAELRGIFIPKCATAAERGVYASNFARMLARIKALGLSVEAMTLEEIEQQYWDATGASEEPVLFPAGFGGW